MSEEVKVKKIIPSKLETGVQQFLYKTLGKHIPKSVSANQVTAFGGIGGLFGITCAFLSRINSLFLIGTIIGLIWHHTCDVLDGFVARSKGTTSKAGGYLDLLIDILHITYLIIAMAFAGVISFQIAVLIVPVYALIIFTAMNYILHLHEFLFPRLGPVETHLFFIAICILGMVFGPKKVLILPFAELTIVDIIFVIGAIPMYYEMIRLQIQLFRRLSKVDKEGKDE